MNKTATQEKPYVDPFLYEVGFFKSPAEREKLVEGVRKMNEKQSPTKAKEAKAKR